ncbi:unnamed protein product [Ambrosiozyma monospora]|uniref:Unnamed protein product n=1 Tax=Ambrosiozyma monospora TaxID=43982 RepID=A0ACB5TKS8_AMBMO|nr:unnamed protein product [Ambrosiozyma monospora]
MLNSTRLSSVLSNLLTPEPEVTDLTPYAVGLISLPEDRAILTASNISYVTGEAKATTSQRSPSTSTTSTTSFQRFVKGNGIQQPYPQHLQFSTAATNYGSTDTVSTEPQPQNDPSVVTDPLKSNDVEHLKAYLDRLNQGLDDETVRNYINRNSSPTDDFKIISQVALRAWRVKKLTNPNPWMVAQLDTGTLLFFYEIDEDYLLLLSCPPDYPKALALERLKCWCEHLANRL